MNRADRKKQIIAQGALHRAEIMLAKQAAGSSLRPDSLARNALHHIVLTALSAFRNRAMGPLPGMNLQTVLPLVMTGISALSKRKPLLKTVLRGAAVAGLAAGIVALVSRRKRAARDAIEDVT